MSKFTPGPWLTPGTDGEEHVISHIDVDGKQRTLAHAYSEANARLIAAAPLMFEKLQRVVVWLEKLAASSEKRAEDKRFLSLSEANTEDAKNWRATAKDISAILAKAVQP